MSAPPPRSPDPLAGTPLHQAWTGFRAAGAGFGFTLRHGDLLSVAALAMALYLAVWVAFLWLAATWDGVAVAAVMGPAPESWWAVALWHVGRVLLYAALWLASLVLAATVALPVLSPAFAWLAERVEQRWYGAQVPGQTWGAFAVETLRGIGRGLALLVIEVTGGVALWAVGMVLTLAFAPLGALFTIAVGGGWGALALGATMSGFALENNRVPLAAQLALLRRRTAVWLGFGFAAQWLVWVPLTVPFLVVSATMLVCRLHDHGHCRLPARDDTTQLPAQQGR